ncbi:MAG: exodeoxyribonuclease VII large subunit, partial [Lachnospiraceae bacterium]|nr:exodeoxyribonuclease VII large subunit [Lachnospiraceae bacterium]
VKQIEKADTYNLDTLIVGRGGGSIEDLWAFNSREVAQAVFDCSVPIISAVGHETDTTIIDYVSDMRAPTPSAAAELAVADIREILQTMENCRNRLGRSMQQRIRSCRESVQGYELRLRYVSPMSRIRDKKLYAATMQERLEERLQKLMQDRRHRLALYIARLKGLSPLEKLNSGYSYVEDMEGSNVRSVEQVSVGQQLVIRMQDGSIEAQVTDVRKAGQV